MKISLAVIASAILFACGPAFAQAGSAPAASADPQTVAATRELLTTIHVHDLMKATMDQLERQLPSQMKASAAAAVNADTTLDAQQKTAAIARLDNDMQEVAVRTHAVLNDPTLIDDMVAQMVPLYADTYTLDELRQLIAFYRSPVGQKTLAVMPALLGRAMEAGNRVVTPRIQKAMAQWAPAGAAH